MRHTARVSANAYEGLKARLGEVWDVTKAAYLLSWDQQTMMPPRAGPVRAAQLGTLSKLAHELFVDDEVGRLLDRLDGLEAELPYESDEASLIRFARREWEKERRVPTELREAMARTAAEAYPI